MNCFDLIPEEEAIKLMPKSIQELATVISFKSVIKLVMNYGGRPLSTHSAYRHDHPLAQLLGQEDYMKLTDFYRGEELEIAVCRVFKRHLRDIHIVKEHLEGQTTNQIAKNHDLTTRAIRLVISRAKKSKPLSTYFTKGNTK